jgi:phage terminase Nu1 subunit (DNA packaging protein)
MVSFRVLFYSHLSALLTNEQKPMQSLKNANMTLIMLLVRARKFVKFEEHHD